jgi:cytochrome b561
VARLSLAAGYGSLTKAFHWTAAVLFALQFSGGWIMVRLGPDQTLAGIGQAAFYNWHKSLGLLALLIAIGRVAVRRLGTLPPWAPTLSPGEQVFIHRAEQVLYVAMFVMPVSGYLYVMAGGYGVRMFGMWDLANPIGEMPFIAMLAKWTHVLSSYILCLAILGHVGLVLRHQLVLKDGLLRRMLPERRERQS